MISPGEQGKTEEQQATPVGVPPRMGLRPMAGLYGSPIHPPAMFFRSRRDVWREFF